MTKNQRLVKHAAFSLNKECSFISCMMFLLHACLSLLFGLSRVNHFIPQVVHVFVISSVIICRSVLQLVPYKF